MRGHGAAAGGARQLDRDRVADDLRDHRDGDGRQMSISTVRRRPADDPSVSLRLLVSDIMVSLKGAANVRRSGAGGLVHFQRTMSASRMMTYSAVGLACSSLRRVIARQLRTSQMELLSRHGGAVRRRREEHGVPVDDRRRLVVWRVVVARLGVHRPVRMGVRVDVLQIVLVLGAARARTRRVSHAREQQTIITGSRVTTE